MVLATESSSLNEENFIVEYGTSTRRVSARARYVITLHVLKPESCLNSLLVGILADAVRPIDTGRPDGVFAVLTSTGEANGGYYIPNR